MFQLAMEDVDQKLQDAGRPYVHVDDDEGIKVKCHNTECIFEFTIYKFIGTFRALPNIPPGGGPVPPGGFRDGGSSRAGNIALIIPSRMLPELDQEKIQEFLDGNAAIQLQARSPGSPIEFILPQGSIPILLLWEPCAVYVLVCHCVHYYEMNDSFDMTLSVTCDHMHMHYTTLSSYFISHGTFLC